MEKLHRIGVLLLRLHDTIVDGLAHVTAWMTLAVTLGIGYEIVMRYFFTRPTRWAADFTDYTMLYTTFLAAAWLAKHGEHVNLTYLLDHLSPRARHIMEGINALFCALVCCFIIWYSAKDTWDAITGGIAINRAIQLPKYLLLGVIPLGCFFLFVQFIRNGFKSFSTSRESPQEEQPETESL